MESIPKMKCPVHGEDLVSARTITLAKQGETVQEPIFYCGKCGRYYIHTRLAEYGSRFDYGDKEVINTETEIRTGSPRVRPFRELRPDADRRTTEQVAGCLLSFEECEQNFRTDYPFSLLHYAFMFRRFDAAEQIMDALTREELDEAIHFPGPPGFEWIEPVVCAKWNLNYIHTYDDRNAASLFGKLEPYLEQAGEVHELLEYTDIIDRAGNDVFSVFWSGRQPILNVIRYDRQMTAASQVMRNGFSLVMDEVGTGKTVSALYAMREVIDRSQKAKILVVCPYNKREDWQNDIRRQLGRYAHIVAQGDPGEIYEGKRKKAFFRRKEPVILVAGQIQGADPNGSHSALKGSVESYAPGEPWDLVILDEAHIAFESYFGISAERLMLLTATPIVVNAKGKRTYEDYQKLAGQILRRPVAARIDPISHPNPQAEDVYVNWFREDFGKSSARRKIRFVSCRRWKERETVFEQIRKKAGLLAALQYDQDDEYLCKEALERYGVQGVHAIIKNAKLDQLAALLHENEKSFIIFCEHQFVADNIFQRLKDEFWESVTAKKYGTYEEQHGLEYVPDGQLVNTLMQALRNGERVLFVTTGKSGGVGLNLGEFDGVIHYELPFTSMELEQRFGRVDRMDTPASESEKDMIFLLNACRPDENDLEVNRMLYYCTTKIDITCQYMPIRNTVLYYPEFIKRNRDAIRNSLISFQKEYVLSEENEREVKRLYQTARSMEKELVEDPLWQYVGQPEKNVRLSAWEALNRPQDPRITKEYYNRLRAYLAYYKSTKPRRTEFQKMNRSFKEARTSTCHWLAAVGVLQVEADSQIFAAPRGEVEPAANVDPTASQPVRQGRSIQRQIAELLRLMETCTVPNEASFSSNGIFCYKDGKISRASVEDYRAGHGWG